jgi:Flp pilus assembly protein TadD
MNQTNLNPALEHLCAKIDRAIVSRDHSQVVELCSKLLNDPRSQEMEKEALAASYLNRGFSRRRLGDLLGALEDARQAALLNPRSFKPHLNAALIYAQDMRDYEKGLEEFDLALRLNPTNVEILSSRGLTKQLMGDHEGAEADLNAALAITPNDPNALCNLGNLHLERGNVSEAAESYQKALTANPKDSEIRVNLALALERMGAHRAAADVLRKDRRSIKLWESKGGFPVRPSGSGWRLALFVVVVVGVLILLWLMNLQVGTR